MSEQDLLLKITYLEEKIEALEFRLRNSTSLIHILNRENLLMSNKLKENKNVEIQMV